MSVVLLSARLPSRHSAKSAYVKALGGDAKRDIKIVGVSENGVQLLSGAKSLVRAKRSAAISRHLLPYLRLSPPSNSPTKGIGEEKGRIGKWKETEKEIGRAGEGKVKEKGRKGGRKREAKASARTYFWSGHRGISLHS